MSKVFIEKYGNADIYFNSKFRLFECNINVDGEEVNLSSHSFDDILYRIDGVEISKINVSNVKIAKMIYSDAIDVDAIKGWLGFEYDSSEILSITNTISLVFKNDDDYDKFEDCDFNELMVVTPELEARIERLKVLHDEAIRYVELYKDFAYKIETNKDVITLKDYIKQELAKQKQLLM